MVGIVDSMRNIANGVYKEVANAGTVIRKGVLVICREGSSTLHDIYCLTGFEKVDKAVVANLEGLSRLLGTGVFKETMKVFKNQKNLIYALKCIDSLNDYIDEKTFTFKIPKIDKIFYTFANFLETGKFFHDYVLRFPKCTELAERLSEVRVFDNYKIMHIPVLNCFCENPKDPFVFVASGIRATNLIKEYWGNGSIDLVKKCKLIDNLGKMALIALGSFFAKMAWFTALSMVVNNASLLGFIFEKHYARQKFMPKPVVEGG